jgi:putative sigma-54 modulation protein
MQINITGHHIDVTEPLRAYVSEKMTKLQRHFDHVTNVHVVLTVEKQGQKAEATVHVSGADLVAQSATTDMYASIDGLVDKLDRQILKHKEKVSDHHKKSGGVKNMALEEEA